MSKIKDLLEKVAANLWDYTSPNVLGHSPINKKIGDDRKLIKQAIKLLKQPTGEVRLGFSQKTMNDMIAQRNSKHISYINEKYRADQLQARLEGLKTIQEILSPYNGKTNPKGRLEAIKSSIKFIENRFTEHDAEDISSCVRCQAVSLARWMSEIIQEIK